MNGCDGVTEEVTRRDFPKDFVFGAATSAYQVNYIDQRKIQDPGVERAFSPNYSPRYPGFSELLLVRTYRGFTSNRKGF